MDSERESEEESLPSSVSHTGWMTVSRVGEKVMEESCKVPVLWMEKRGMLSGVVAERRKSMDVNVTLDSMQKTDVGGDSMSRFIAATYLDTRFPLVSGRISVG